MVSDDTATSLTSLSSASAVPDVAALPFEKAMAELEAIVGQLEKGSVPLEESIAIYERIEKITLGPDGTPAGLEPLDVEDPSVRR